METRIVNLRLRLRLWCSLIEMGKVILVVGLRTMWMVALKGYQRLSVKASMLDAAAAGKNVKAITLNMIIDANAARAHVAANA